MRENKFRGWDSVNEKMLPVEYIDFRNQYISLDEGDNSISDTFEMIQLMQYTGLKDISGKDIYEGDIVTLNGSISRYEVIFTDFEVKGKSINLINSEIKLELWINALIVVGNIYEK